MHSLMPPVALSLVLMTSIFQPRRSA
jgi:hypothetical protein